MNWTLWSFTDTLYEDSLIRCNECGELSCQNEWQEGEVYCEDCGDHMAMVCPKCGHAEDHVWSSDSPMDVVNGD